MATTEMLIQWWPELKHRWRTQTQKQAYRIQGGGGGWGVSARKFVGLPSEQVAVTRSDVKGGSPYHVTYPMMRMMYLAPVNRQMPVETLASRKFVSRQ